MSFDWHTWLDVQRQLAERRTDSRDPAVVRADPEYARALDIAGRADRGRRAMEEAEREARGMSFGRGQTP